MSQQITIPATIVNQSGKKCYLCTFTYAELVKFFTFVDEELPLDQRHQRHLDTSRAKKIGNYIFEGHKSGNQYIIPPIVASLDAKNIEFEGNGIGKLTFDLATAKMLINDGQHRRRGIEFALEDNPNLESEEVGVFLIPDVNLKAAQQIFSDINRNAKPTDKNLNYLFDHRSGDTATSKSVRTGVPFFVRYVQLEKGIETKRYLFQFAHFHEANLIIYEHLRLQNIDALKAIPMMKLYWNTLVDSIKEWKSMIELPNITEYDKKSATASIQVYKKDTIAGHNITLQSLALLSKKILPKYVKNPDDLAAILEPLGTFSFGKENPLFHNKIVVEAVTGNLKVICNNPSKNYLVYLLEKHLDLSDDEAMTQKSLDILTPI